MKWAKHSFINECKYSLSAQILQFLQLQILVNANVGNAVYSLSNFLPPQVYKGKSWSLAEDHINFTLGRQSFNLKQLDNATAAFKHLLTAESKQSVIQQNAFLKEYLFVYKVRD